DGVKVDGPAALREAILIRPDAFVTALTIRMMTYALGRGIEPSDMPVVRRIVKKAAQNDYHFASIILGIVESPSFQLRTNMQPLEPFRDQLVTVSQMKAPWGASVHLGASSAFLNGVGPVATRDDGTSDAFGKLQSKKTVDQYIADKVAEDTPLRSIEVGTEDMGTTAGACDGFPCVFFNTLSWRDDTSPLPVGINPRVTFERMFGETGTASQRYARLKQKQSMLDSIAAETAKLRRQLGPSDNAILDEYLHNIRDVELTLERMEARANTVVDAAAPIGIPEAFDDHMKVTYDLMRLAFQGDISSFLTFMVGHEASSRSYA